jgi:hypothetical protein
MIDSLRTFHAIDIASETESVTRQSYEDSIPEYEEKDWDFMPMLKEREYYIVPEEDWGEIKEEQFISGGANILEVMRKLEDHPFLLIKNNSGLYIITMADLNQRRVKEMIYPVKAELANSLAQNLRDFYSSEELENRKELGDSTLRIWNEAKNRNVNLHITEFLNLIDMKKLVENSEPFREKSGLSSVDNPGRKIGKVNELRKKIMHGNRTLIYSENRVEKVVKRTEFAMELIETLEK